MADALSCLQWRAIWENGMLADDETQKLAADFEEHIVGCSDCTQWWNETKEELDDSILELRIRLRKIQPNDPNTS